jgi:hypothetical protein
VTTTTAGTIIGVIVYCPSGGVMYGLVSCTMVINTAWATGAPGVLALLPASCSCTNCYLVEEDSTFYTNSIGPCGGDGTALTGTIGSTVSVTGTTGTYANSAIGCVLASGCVFGADLTVTS